MHSCLATPAEESCSAGPPRRPRPERVGSPGDEEKTSTPVRSPLVDEDDVDAALT